jgi:chemotaxis protein CheD
MNTLVVGVGECRVTNNPQSVLVTYALGSCIAVIVHDPVARVGGLLHFMLPESSLDRAKAEQNPFLFADTGIPRLFQRACELGAQRRRMIVTAAGGAQLLDDNGVFNIGRRNRLAMRKALWQANLALYAEHTGGTESRTVRLEVDTGRVFVRDAGQPQEDLLAPALEARNA